MAKTINMECPICKKKVLFVGVHDDEGNYHGLVGCEYENDPWSGLSYALHHEGWGDCPMCTDGAYSTMGGMLFDTAEDAISALTPPNEWVSVEERLPDKPGHYLVCTSINYWHGGCMDVNQEHKYHDNGTPVGYDGTTMSVLDCYYDITGDWNRVCNKHVTHWMHLPAPPDRRPPEGEEDT